MLLQTILIADRVRPTPLYRRPAPVFRSRRLGRGPPRGVRAMLKNFWFQTHWLIGITAGVILAVVGLTGGILSFETEIQDWLNRDVRRVEAPAHTALSPADLLASVQSQLPGRAIQSIQVYSDPSSSARVTLAPAGGAGAPERGGRGGARGETRYVNPYTGELISGEGNVGQGFFRGTRSLHRWLTVGELGSQAVGKQLVGASTMLCVVLALSGLYLRWPRRAGNWRTWLTFDPSLKGRSFLWHLHAILGTWVLVGFILMSLTGLYWSYDWYRNGLFAMAGVERPAPRGEGGNERPARSQAREGDGPGARSPGAGGREAGGAGGREGAGAERPRREASGAERGERAAAAFAPAALEHAWSSFTHETRNTGFTSATVNLPREPGRPIEIRYLDADPAHDRANNTLALDAATSAVVRHERYDSKRAGEKFMSSIFPLHSGSFFGLPGVLAYMIASLAMPVFAITGWMLYLDRRRKKKAARAAESAATGGSHPSSGTAQAEPLLLGFASQAGFARELAWQTAGSLKAAGIAVDVQPLERLDRDTLGRARRALFVVSTFGEGEPPDAARSFARRLMSDGASLANLRFGVLALGDRQYKTFCEFGRTLDRWLHRQGAQPLFPTVEVDKQDPQALENWRERLGSLADGRSIGAWHERPFHSLRLEERRLLNPGSAGSPTYHLELSGSPLQTWEAGDIAEIEIGSAEEARPTREFSIASISGDGRIHLLVRLARKNDGSLGVGSGWLTQLVPLQGEVPVRVRSNPTFHAPGSAVPLILIGNGTGIAGLRSHLKRRAALGHRRNWLVFGERHRAIDFYYRDEIEAWQAAGVLERVDLAFSRDQVDRVYVQQRLAENAETVREWVAEGAAIYVCGSAEGMAPAVDAVLGGILGEAEVERLRELGRYRRDVY